MAPPSVPGTRRRLQRRCPHRTEGGVPLSFPRPRWRSLMDIVVKGRHCEVSDRYREHVAEKLSRVEKYDHKVIRIDVMVTAERNPRQHATAVCVELTVRSRGPVVRAECCAEDKLAALDGAWAKLEERLRRASDRRRGHRGARTPVAVARATADLPLDTLVDDEPSPESGLHLVGPLL